MKIKRYFAKDVKTAIQMVRDDQGPDAVIMSNNKVDDGIEIIAAVDYDEKLFTNNTPAIKSFSSSKPYPTEDIDQSAEYINEYVTSSDIAERQLTGKNNKQANEMDEIKSQIINIKEIAILKSGLCSPVTIFPG